jgi:hypothetical protein
MFFRYLVSSFDIYPQQLTLLLDFLDDVRLIRIRNIQEIATELHTIIPLFVLVGSIIYYLTKFRDSKFLRLSLSIVFLLIVVSLLNNAMTFYFFYDLIDGSVFGMIYFYLLRFFILWILYHMIRKLNEADEFEFEFNEKHEEVPLIADKGTRFLNHLIDSFFTIVVTMLILGTLFTIAKYLRFESLSEGFFAEFVVPALLGIVAMFIVYFLMELCFSRTPAKFLSYSVVIFPDEKKKKGYNIFIRTLYRMIPILDVASFVIGTKTDGLHDTFSHTTVVKTKRTGISRAWYILFVPLLILLPFLPNYLQEKIDESKKQDRRTSYTENKYKRFLQKLDTIKSGAILYRNRYFYLVDSIGEENLYLSEIAEAYDLERKLTEEYTLSNYIAEFDSTFIPRVIKKTSLISSYNDRWDKPNIYTDAPEISDAVLYDQSSTYLNRSERGKKALYELKIKTFNCPCKVENLDNVDATLEMNISYRTYDNSIEIGITDDEKNLEKQSHTLELTLVNTKSLRKTTYRIEMDHYGISNFYEVN